MTGLDIGHAGGATLTKSDQCPTLLRHETHTQACLSAIAPLSRADQGRQYRLGYDLADVLQGIQHRLLLCPYLHLVVLVL